MTDFQRDLEVIINNTDFVHNGNIRFVYRYPSRMDGEIDELELSVRGEHAMKRARIFKISDVGRRWDELNVRGSGAKTIKEIKNKYLAYYYSKLNEEERKEFWRDMVTETEKMAAERK